MLVAAGPDGYSGVLTATQQGKARAIILSLGIMARRGNSTAQRALDDMSVVEYWRGKFKWRPDELVTPDHLTSELESLRWVLRAQIVAQHNEVDELRNAVLVEIDVPQRRKYFADDTDIFRMRSEADQIFDDEERMTSQHEHRMLEFLYNNREERLESFRRWDIK